jgi:hypothetical protein
VLDEVAEKLLQRFGVRVHADEDPAAPHRDADLGERQVDPLQVLEVPRTRDVDELALQVPGEAVEGTAKLGDAARTLTQQSPAVQARVVEGANPVVIGPDDDQRGVRDLVDHTVAAVGDLLLAARDLPHALPHAGDLAVVPVLRDVPVDVDGTVHRLREGDLTQDGRYRIALLVQQLLDALLRDLRGAHQRGTRGTFDHRVTVKPAACASHVVAVTPRSRSTCFCTRSVGVRGSSSRNSM